MGWRATADRLRRDPWIATVAGVACFVVYLTTLCRSLYWYDSAEYVTAAVTLGIPHPPGYPLYTLIAHVFTWLPVDAPTAVSLMSATFAAIAVGLTFLVARRLGASRSGALIGAISLGLGRLFWSQAVIAEVYTPGIAFLMAALLLLLRGLDQNRARPILLAAGLAGLGLGVHLSIATCGLGLAVLVWSIGLPGDGPGQLRALVGRRQLGRRARVAAGALGATLLGSLIFLYLPIRASMGPALNFGNPSTWDRFWWAVTGGNYKHWFSDQLDLIERAARLAGSFYQQLPTIGLVLALLGLVALVRRRPVWGLAWLLMMAGNVYFFFDYQVHDLEVFFLPTTALLCAAIGLGVDSVLGLLERALRAGRGPLIRRLAAGALWAFPVSLFLANYHPVDMSDFTDAEEYGDALVDSLPRGAVILNYATPPEWQRDAVFGFYYQMVLHARPDVQVRTDAQPPEVIRLLRAGVPVFQYYPVAAVQKILVLREEGVLYRVVGIRRPPPRTPPSP